MKNILFVNWIATYQTHVVFQNESLQVIVEGLAPFV